MANEGVRVSKLVEFIAKASVAGAAKPLLKKFLDAKPPGVETESSGPIRPPAADPKPDNEEDLPVSDDTKASGSDRVKDLGDEHQFDFGPISNWDVLEREGAEESFTGDVPAVVPESVADVVL